MATAMYANAAAIADRQAALSGPGPDRLYWQIAAALLGLRAQSPSPAQTSRAVSKMEVTPLPLTRQGGMSVEVTGCAPAAPQEAPMSQ